jgi:hypothetical protein
MDRIHDSIKILSQIIIPEAQHPIAFGLEPQRPGSVAPLIVRFAVLRAVELNDKP